MLTSSWNGEGGAAASSPSAPAKPVPAGGSSTMLIADAEVLLKSTSLAPAARC